MDWLCNFYSGCEGYCWGELEPREDIMEAGEICRISQCVAR